MKTYNEVLDDIQDAGGSEAWIAQDPENRGHCEICGEVYDLMGPPSLAEVAEFVKPAGPETTTAADHVIAHGQCGFDHGLEMA